MIEKGSIVKLIEMWDEYPFGWDKSWLEGAVGIITDYKKITNINDGHINELCTLDFITPVVSINNNPIKSYCIHTQNLQEIIREPIMITVEREPIISQETKDYE